MADGAVAGAAVADGAVAGAAVAGAAVADGEVADGAVAEGDVADGAVADGAVADAAVAEIVPGAEPVEEERGTRRGERDPGVRADASRIAGLEPAGEPSRTEVMERLESALARMERLAVGAPVVDALERLVALHREGWLSEAELAEAKGRVLRDAAPGELRRVGPGRQRRTIAVDFDGVVHSYASGWKGACVIADPPVEGAIEWLVAAVERFDVAIFSVRASSPGAVDAMRAWLRRHGLPDHVLARITFPVAKPPAELYIDDRAYRFEGTFPSFEELASLSPWNRGR